MAHDKDDPRGDMNGEPVEWVEPAKDIPRKKRAFHFLEPVRPPATTLIERQETFKALTAQVSSDKILVTASHLQGIPRVIHLARFTHAFHPASLLYIVLALPFKQATAMRVPISYGTLAS